MASKLYEVEQPYYCSESNFFAKPHQNEECYMRFLSFDQYLQEAENLDPDLNLLFRWDWQENNHLILHIFLQRKGYKITHDILVTEDDEPKIRKFLKERSKTILSFWEHV